MTTHSLSLTMASLPPRVLSPLARARFSSSSCSRASSSARRGPPPASACAWEDAVRRKVAWGGRGAAGSREIVEPWIR